MKDSVLNIYRHLTSEAFKADPPKDPVVNYNRYGALRKVLHLVVNALQSAGSEHHLEFDNLLLIVHYYAMRSAMQTLSGLDGHISKISTSLLRHTNIIPADRAFYEAGLNCRAARKTDMALMFMNRFLDLVEAIEADDGMLDPEGFEETEIPLEVPLPEQVCLPAADVEEIRNWVLNMSIDQRNTNQELPKDKRGVFEGNIGHHGRPCIITGYPVISDAIEFRKGHAANKSDWRSFIHQVIELIDPIQHYTIRYPFHFP